MSERQGFLDAIRLAPDDPAPRLIYADWLDEHGEELRAGLTRFQCSSGRPIDLAPSRLAQLYRNEPPRGLDRTFVTGSADFFRTRPPEFPAANTFYETEVFGFGDCLDDRPDVGRWMESPAVRGIGTRLFRLDTLAAPGFAKLAEVLGARTVALSGRGHTGEQVPRRAFPAFPHADELELRRLNLWRGGLDAFLGLLPGPARGLTLVETPLPADGLLASDRLDGVTRLRVSGDDGISGRLGRLALPAIESFAADGESIYWLGRVCAAGWARQLVELAIPARVTAYSRDIHALGIDCPHIRRLRLAWLETQEAFRRDAWPCLEELHLTNAAPVVVNTLAASDVLPYLTAFSLIGGVPGWGSRGRLLPALAASSRLESLQTRLDIGDADAWRRYLAAPAGKLLRNLALFIDGPADLPPALFDPSQLPEMRSLTLTGATLPKPTRRRLIDVWGMRCNLFWEG